MSLHTYTPVSFLVFHTYTGLFGVIVGILQSNKGKFDKVADVSEPI